MEGHQNPFFSRQRKIMEDLHLHLIIDQTQLG